MTRRPWTNTEPTRLADALLGDCQEQETQPQEDESTYYDWEYDVIEHDQQEEY